MSQNGKGEPNWEAVMKYSCWGILSRLLRKFELNKDEDELWFLANKGDMADWFPENWEIMPSSDGLALTFRLGKFGSKENVVFKLKGKEKFSPVFYSFFDFEEVSFMMIFRSSAMLSSFLFLLTVGGSITTISLGPK